MKVTFFGHRDTPETIRPVLYNKLEELIMDQKTILFLIGNRGRFDTMVLQTVKALKQRYPEITYRIILSDLPQNSKAFGEDLENTIVAEGSEEGHPRYAIVRCNRWMLKEADVVITYVTRGFGGAATFKKEAERKGKRVINLA